MNLLAEIPNLSDQERIETLQNILISRATHEEADNDEYQILRTILIKNHSIKNLLPAFLKTHRNLDQFWSFIKNKYATYDERRNYLWDQFTPVLNFLENNNPNPALPNITNSLIKVNNNYIHSIWEKSLDRIKEDPEGAITIARTLLETTCKFILDERNIDYDSTSLDLSELYKLTATELNLAPEQHDERIFKQILGGCSGIVNGLGTLRNKLGDAHAPNGRKVKPLPRHSRLTVNLAGSMSAFLLETHQETTD